LKAIGRNLERVQGNIEAGMPASAGRSEVEAQLLDYVRQLERSFEGWRAVHVHLSRLKADNRRDYLLRIAASEFSVLLRRLESDLFQLRNGDLVYIWRGAGIEEIDQVVLRLRYLLSDDPLLAEVEPEPVGETQIEPEAELTPEPRLCTWFELGRNFDSFRFAIEDLVEQAASQPSPATALRALDPARLGELEAKLAGADLSGLIRRQPICAIVSKAPPQPVLREVHLAVGELAERLMPGFDLTADPWLFQRLAETLDRHLLANLATMEAGQEAEAISINLRLATLLSPDFLKFDQQFRERDKRQVIVELQLVDIYAEFGAYLFIREFARERGYRICLDGLHHLHLPLISRKRLGADLVKLFWSPDLLYEVNPARHEELKSAIRQTGNDRVILCRCDSADAIAWGESFGIRLFQGHYIDSRLRAIRSPAVAEARKALRATRTA
jgi:hypothetical protein